MDSVWPLVGCAQRQCSLYCRSVCSSVVPPAVVHKQWCAAGAGRLGPGSCGLTSLFHSALLWPHASFEYSVPFVHHVVDQMPPLQLYATDLLVGSSVYRTGSNTTIPRMPLLSSPAARPHHHALTHVVLKTWGPSPSPGVYADPGRWRRRAHHPIIRHRPKLQPHAGGLVRARPSINGSVTADKKLSDPPDSG
jgi:hypothetical protein